MSPLIEAITRVIKSESVSKLEFRFQNNLLPRIYNKLRHIRQGGIILHLKLKLGLTSLPEIMRERKRQDENE
ncbi:MAG: hypothetical protein V5A76_00985 [Candidatus Thermoplasmatota archaeon]